MLLNQQRSRSATDSWPGMGMLEQITRPAQTFERAPRAGGTMDNLWRRDRAVNDVKWYARNRGRDIGRWSTRGVISIAFVEKKLVLTGYRNTRYKPEEIPLAKSHPPGRGAEA